MSFIKGYNDITTDWLNNVVKGNYLELSIGDTFHYNDNDYFIDGKNVTTEGMNIEKEFAQLLNEKYGIQITVLPRIEIPERIKTPDYYINDIEKMDLKTIKGESPRTFKNAMGKQKGKAEIFIFNVINDNISIEIADERIRKLFYTSDVSFLRIAILFKNQSLIKVYERKK